MRSFLLQLKKDRVSEYSAESAFFIILSIIPFVLVFMSLIQYINLDKETIIGIAIEIIPNVFQEFSLNIIEEIYSKTITTLSISILFTIWSASKGIFAITKGINDIYGVNEKNYIFGKIKAFLCTILFMFLLIVMLVFIVLWNNVFIFIKPKISIELFSKWVPVFKICCVAIIIFTMFLLFYKYIPNCKLNFKNQIVGSLFVTIFWYILSYGFSLYIQVYSGFSILYGSLTTIILFMIWTYCLIYITFIGAEINVLLKSKIM